MSARTRRRCKLLVVMLLLASHLCGKERCVARDAGGVERRSFGPSPGVTHFSSGVISLARGASLSAVARDVFASSSRRSSVGADEGSVRRSDVDSTLEPPSAPAAAVTSAPFPASSAVRASPAALARALESPPPPVVFHLATKK